MKKKNILVIEKEPVSAQQMTASPKVYARPNHQNPRKRKEDTSEFFAKHVREDAIVLHVMHSVHRAPYCIRFYSLTMSLLTSLLRTRLMRSKPMAMLPMLAIVDE